MKKIVVALVLVLLTFSLVSALDLALPKTSYYPGETLQLEIPDVFIGNLEETNIGIYEGVQVHKTPGESGLLKPEKKYLYYIILPENTGNYSVRIENIKYYEGSVQTEKTITKNFTIVGTNTSYLSFKPGYVYTGQDFTIILKAYNDYQDVSIIFPPTGIDDNIESFGYGDTKTLFFSIKNLKSTVKDNIKINTYSIPAVITPKTTTTNTTDTTEVEENYTLSELLAVSMKEIDETILSNQLVYYQATIVNKEQSIKDLVLTTSDPEIQVSPKTISLLSGEQTINITIQSKRALDGYVNISKGDSYLKIPVKIEVTEEQTEVTPNTDALNSERNCAFFGGKKCNAEAQEICKGSETQASDGICCIGQCKTKSGSSGWIVGILILVLLGVGGWFLYKKSKEQSPAGEKIRQMFKKKSDDYEKRFVAKKEPVEVRKSLSKD